MLAGSAAGCRQSPAGAGDGALGAPAVSHPSAPAPTLSVVPSSVVPWDTPVRVSVAHGTLRSVRMSDPTGSVVPGAISSDGRSWTNTTTLVPNTHYVVSADLLDAGKQPSTGTVAFSTAPAADTVSTVITPGDNDVVGVGQPVIVSFDRTVTDRRVVEEHLSVTAVPAVLGAWHWVSATEVHYRPRVYWPAGERITVSTSLDGVNVGNGVWGDRNHTARFTVGASRISYVNVARHTMSVTEGGRLIRVLPISAGRDKYPTVGGVHIALEKSPEIIMDSATVGIPRNSPDGYYETVFWDVRISDGGTFVHAAPWSVADQGHSNVSHGCVNLSPADAAWYYRFTQRGDVIDIRGTTRGPDISDPGMADWNIPWSQWAGT